MAHCKMQNDEKCLAYRLLLHIYRNRFFTNKPLKENRVKESRGKERKDSFLF